MFIEPVDESKLVEKILQLVEKPDLKEKLGLNGRMYVEANYDRQIIAERFIDFISKG